MKNVIKFKFQFHPYEKKYMIRWFSAKVQNWRFVSVNIIRSYLKKYLQILSRIKDPSNLSFPLILVTILAKFKFNFYDGTK